MSQSGWRTLGQRLYCLNVFIRCSCKSGLGTRVAAVMGCPQLDTFAQEDVKYVARLMDANITTELHVYDGLPHVFELYALTCSDMRIEPGQ